MNIDKGTYLYLKSAITNSTCVTKYYSHYYQQLLKYNRVKSSM